MIVRGRNGWTRVSREQLMGDPFLGFLGKFLGKAGKAIFSAAKGLFGLGQMTAGGAMPMPMPASMAMGLFPGNAQGALPGFPGTNIPLGPPVGFGTVMRGAAAAGMAIGRSIRGGSQGYAALMGGRRRRRMNPGNFRALGRALRRLESFERRARRVVRITHPRARVRGFKIKRRRRAA